MVLDTNRKQLFYSEKDGCNRYRVVGIDLNDEEHNKTYFPLEDSTAVFNFVAPDQHSLCVLFRKQSGYFFRSYDLETRSYKEIKIYACMNQKNPQSISDYLTVSHEMGLAAVGSYEPMGTYCSNLIKIFDEETLSLLTEKQLDIDHQQGSHRD